MALVPPSVATPIGAARTADDPRRYQPPDEIDQWRERDPLPRLRRYLERRGVWDADAEREAADDAVARIDAAVAEAEARPVPTFETYIQSAT